MKTKLFKLTMTLAVTFSLSTAYIVPAMAVEENNNESIQLNTVDKSNLERIINQYDYDALLAQEGYPMYQKQEIKDALENANTVYNNPNVTQEEVDNAYHRLNNAGCCFTRPRSCWPGPRGACSARWPGWVGWRRPCFRPGCSAA